MEAEQVKIYFSAIYLSYEYTMSIMVNPVEFHVEECAGWVFLALTYLPSTAGKKAIKARDAVTSPLKLSV